MPPTDDDTRRAVEAFLQSLGYDLRGDRGDTPGRVSDLWRHTLLAGEATEPATILAGAMLSDNRAAVSLAHIDVHLVCPHHLTVAFGRAHVAYAPDGHLASFGSLVELVQACTARLVLQEEATTSIADALVEHLGARAALVLIEAQHPCHNLTQPRAHRSHVATRATRGDAAVLSDLESSLQQARVAPSALEAPPPGEDDPA